MSSQFTYVSNRKWNILRYYTACVTDVKMYASICVLFLDLICGGGGGSCINVEWERVGFMKQSCTCGCDEDSRGNGESESVTYS